MKKTDELRAEVTARLEALEAIPPQQRGEQASSILARDYNELRSAATYTQVHASSANYSPPYEFNGQLPPDIPDSDAVTYRDLVYLYQQILGALSR